MRTADYSTRVVVTGLGVISPIGVDVGTAWRNLLDGVSGVSDISRFDASPYEAKVGAEVRDFDVAEWLDSRFARRSDRSVHFAVAAAKQALADSGLEIDDEIRDEVGVVFGCAGGGQDITLGSHDVLHEKGPRAVSPFAIAYGGIGDSSSGMIAIETGARGHNMAVGAACSTGTATIGEAAEAIRRGDCDAVIAGATENPINEVVFAVYANMRALGRPLPGAPDASASRPFDRTRNGFVLGDGAASLILERLDSAKARRARIYAEVVGYATSADACDMAIPAAHGEGATRAIARALARARVRPDEIQVINPHGTSTPVGDEREAEAFWTVFGDHTPEILVSATKSMTGHMMGAAGALEAVATVLSIHHGIVPGTINYAEPDPACNLNVATETIEREVRFGLSDSIGLGGHNAAIVIKRYDGD